MLSSDSIEDSPRDPNAFWQDLLCVAIGALMILCVSGYQFGRGNHTVYLLDALRLNDPTLFSNDWFVSRTLQYHAVFSRVTAALLHAGVLKQSFLIGYLLLIVIWSATWLGLTRALGGSRAAFLLSIVLYELSGAGIALGVYQFLQDGCFLPSNVSNVAMLAAFYCWIVNRRAWAGVWFGLAGLFHLNYAVISVGAWTVLSGWLWWDARKSRAPNPLNRYWWIGTIAAMVPSLFNVGIALLVKLHESSDAMPMSEFVDVYVRFRHPHHFDPLHYPAALWIAFLWPLPIAFATWRMLWRESSGRPSQRAILQETAKIFILMLALQIIAFLFAGVWFVSETLVQLMLWRFSVYVKLMSCVAAAWLICDSKILKASTRATIQVFIPAAFMIAFALAMSFSARPLDESVYGGSSVVALHAVATHWRAILLFILLSTLPAIFTFMPSIFSGSRARQVSLAGMSMVLLIAFFGWSRWLGWGMTPESVDSDYLRMCDWARTNTPKDAVFLVPPAETAFRLEAQRSIVVNYKHVPQLSAELLEWLRRLKDVLGVDEVNTFPRDYVKTMNALNARYESRSPDDLMAVAKRWNARFVVVDHSWGESSNSMLAYGDAMTGYFVYDLNRRLSSAQ